MSRKKYYSTEACLRLEFKNSYDKRRTIAKLKNEEEVFQEIKKFCTERNFKIPYVRTWCANEYTTVYDVGSHTEFFYAVDEIKELREKVKNKNLKGEICEL